MQGHHQNVHQPCNLEINVISAEDLRIINGRSIKKNAVVYVSSDSSDVGSTKINKEGGSFPVWDEKFDVRLPMHATTIVVQVFCGEDHKLIGKATIPVSDFMVDFLPSSYMHLLSYRLRDERGFSNGIINLSIRVKDKD